jgi:hypothetical protein
MNKYLLSIPDKRCQQIMKRVAEGHKPARAFHICEPPGNTYLIVWIAEQATMTSKTPKPSPQKAILTIAAILLVLLARGREVTGSATPRSSSGGHKGAVASG